MGGIKSLKAYIERIPDFRRRQGRIYPLTGLLMMLILAAVNGESSLRPKELGKNLLGSGNGMAPPPTCLRNSLANIEPFRDIQTGRSLESVGKGGKC
jgi:hypothetical protein